MLTLGLQGQDTPMSQREKEAPGPLARKVDQYVRRLLRTHLPTEVAMVPSETRKPSWAAGSLPGAHSVI